MARKAGPLERMASWAGRRAGSSWAFALALGTVLAWAVTGPVFGFSDTWQLVINTGTTVVTFLMVFLLQRAQNKDAQAIQLKLNELVAAVEGASNRLINLEDLSEGDLRALHAHYGKLAELAGRGRRLTESHSVEEAEGRHRAKSGEARRGGGGPGPPGPGATGDDDELAGFLRAAERLREKARWHEEQAAAAREALARQAADPPDQRVTV